MRINLTLNLFIITLTFVSELLVALDNGGVVSEHWKPYVMLIIAVIPKFTAILAQFSNPDGTPAKLPYQPLKLNLPLKEKAE